MSLKYEQLRSVVETRNLLYMLHAGRISMPEAKERAGYCLHHFPPLDLKGEPMFSNDNFHCPPINERGI